MDVIPLWRVPRPRINKKTKPPPWWNQVEEVARTMKKIQGHFLAGQFWDDVPVPRWLEERGAVTFRTIQGLISTLHAEIRRDGMLIALEPICRTNRWHWPKSWAAKERPKCALCGFVGYASQPAHSSET